VSVFEVGIGFAVFLNLFGFGISISKYRDIGIGVRYFSTFAGVLIRSLCAEVYVPYQHRTSAICAHLYDVDYKVAEIMHELDST